MANFPIEMSEEIADALCAGRGVVALESTVIAHGLPYPDNLACAQQLEASVREQGAMPAMIAIMDGRVRIGLPHADLERIADPCATVTKVSRRDIAYTIAQKNLGATTVCATMIAAFMAGIKIFSTGGIGGVHRGAEKSGDISADLNELSKTPVAVVCAGAKSILDIPKTLEMLESYGVPVIGFRTEFFPEFYCIGQRYPLAMSCDEAQDLAAIVHTHFSMGLTNGLVIAQNIAPTDALNTKFIEAIIEQAHDAAWAAKIQGKELTPFLLQEIAKQSERESLKSNTALLIANARLAAMIANSYAELASKRANFVGHRARSTCSGVAGTGNEGSGPGRL